MPPFNPNDGETKMQFVPRTREGGYCRVPIPKNETGARQGARMMLMKLSSKRGKYSAIARASNAMGGAHA